MRPTRHGGDSRNFFDWLEIAAGDLLAARLLIEQGQCLEAAGFHCQQAMEKAFKAFLIEATGQLVDGHNLTWLCRQASKHHRGYARFLDATAGMNRLYIETRYPSDIDLRLSPARAGQIYETARELYDMVCDELYDDAEPEED